MPNSEVSDELVEEVCKYAKYEQITSFRGDHFFLSNFYPCKIIFNGKDYKTAEHAFQAQKCVLEEDIVKIQEANNPQMAKRIGKGVKLREDWEDVKVDLMSKIVEAKFEQNEELRNKLIETYPAILIEENDWNDRFWGVCEGKGKNTLGEILMDVRDKFVNKLIDEGAGDKYIDRLDKIARQAILDGFFKPVISNF